MKAGIPITGTDRAPRVLITEDEYIVALDLQLRLQKMGCEVLGIAASGDDAILQVQEKNPDLVLMDIMLEGEMDGIEAAQHILKDHDLPVIFLTANSDHTTMERASGTHPFSYLLKPFKERELRFSIDMALHHHRVARELREARAELENRVHARTAELVATNAALQNELLLRQQALAELREARTIAESADRAKNEFLATISHELLTPMNGILGMLEVLQDSSPTPSQRDHLGIVQASAEGLLNIINELLDFSRVEEGSLVCTPTPFSLREQIQAYLAPLAFRAREKELAFSWSVAEDVPDHLNADPNRIGQILFNIVGNAVKFTDAGEVEVSVSKQSREEGRAQLRFTIRDTGVGIREDKQRIIFEPFVQADSPQTRRYNGVGLGLSIASRLVSMMGGQIELNSIPGKGSTFQFALWLDLVERPATELVGR